MTTKRDGPQRPGRVLITLPDDLRAAVQRAAFSGNRPVNAEINMRLRATFGLQPEDTSLAVRAPVDAEQVGLTYQEATLIGHFRSLPERKREALIALLA